MSTVAAQTDRRFRRHHVKPARHRRTWQSMIWPVVLTILAAAAAGVAMVRARTLIASLGVLQVEHIVVHGNERVSKGEVLGILEGLRGESLFGADLDTWRQKLMASPWVKDAALRRSLPSTVDVAISERAPVGISRVGEAMYLVDERGVLIDQYGLPFARSTFRSSTAWRRRPPAAPPRTPRGQSWRRASSHRFTRSRGWRKSCRRSTSATCAMPR